MRERRRMGIKKGRMQSERSLLRTYSDNRCKLNNNSNNNYMQSKLMRHKMQKRKSGTNIFGHKLNM